MKFTISFLFSFILASIATASEVVHFDLTTQISNCTISRSARKHAISCNPIKLSSQPVAIELSNISETALTGAKAITVNDSGIQLTVMLNVQKVNNGDQVLYVVSPIFSAQTSDYSVNSTYAGEQFASQYLHDLNDFEIRAKPIVRGDKADYIRFILRPL